MLELVGKQRKGFQIGMSISAVRARRFREEGSEIVEVLLEKSADQREDGGGEFFGGGRSMAQDRQEIAKRCVTDRKRLKQRMDGVLCIEGQQAKARLFQDRTQQRRPTAKDQVLGEVFVPRRLVPICERGKCSRCIGEDRGLACHLKQSKGQCVDVLEDQAQKKLFFLGFKGVELLKGFTKDLGGSNGAQDGFKIEGLQERRLFGWMSGEISAFASALQKGEPRRSGRAAEGLGRLARIVLVEEQRGFGALIKGEGAQARSVFEKVRLEGFEGRIGGKQHLKKIGDTVRRDR